MTKLYEPCGVSAVLAVVVEDGAGHRHLALERPAGAGPAWAGRKPYCGHVRPDPVPGHLRVTARLLGVPGWADAEIPEGVCR